MAGSARRRRADFNPRAYVRHDEEEREKIRDIDLFQSTCLREARRDYYMPRDFEEISIHVPT